MVSAALIVIVVIIVRGVTINFKGALCRVDRGKSRVRAQVARGCWCERLADEGALWVEKEVNSDVDELVERNEGEEGKHGHEARVAAPQEDSEPLEEAPCACGGEDDSGSKVRGKEVHTFEKLPCLCLQGLLEKGGTGFPITLKVVSFDVTARSPSCLGGFG